MTKSIDELLRQTLSARAAPQTPCLDAETAAALADDALSAHERSGAEAHLADCARCQALLAALVRTTPPAAARGWWRRPAIAWLAPLTVAAAGVIVWVSVTRTSVAPAVQSARVGPPSVESDSRPTPPAAAAAEMRSESSSAAAAAPSAAPRSAAKRERERTTPEPNVLETTPPRALADKLIAPPAAPAAPAGAEVRSADAQRPPLPPVAAPPASAAEAGARRPAAAEPAPPPLAETVTVTDAAQQGLTRRLAVARETMIVSSDPMVRWRIGTGGVVDLSTDSGSTWRTHATGANVTLTAGSSPSRSVCWLVGPAGVVVVSTNEGRSWQRLAFPVAIDLLSVRATDDKTATVVASDGRTFSTSDGGRTWRR
jgi:hypothetical protein